MKYTALFVFALLFGSLHAQELCPIIPTPQVYRGNGEVWKTGKEIIIDWGELPEETRNYFTEKMHKLFDVRLQETPVYPQVVFRRDPLLTPGHYRLDTKNGIRVEFSDDRSAFYAINSLLQMIVKGSEFTHVNSAQIEDGPAFEWRGLHLDVSRHFFTVEEVKRFIDLMALYKFSVFHWHLTDDQGWRIEIKKYPKLTEVGAFRDSTVIGHYSDSPRKYSHERYGGFYTQEQIREVVQYAADRYITVVPEIELPGHSRAALAAYPQYSCTGAQQEVPGLWGIFDDIYCSKEESIVFLQDILTEVIALFPSKFIHIGGDEAPKTRWKECVHCQANIKKHGLKDEHELQSYVIGRMDEFLTAQGKQLIGWDEILEGGLSPNAAVMSWRGESGGIEAARQKHQVVMSPTTYCYFDYYQSAHRQEPLAIGGYLPLEKVYAFNPVPSELSGEEAKYILGGQANLWTEYIPDMHQLEYMTYPRALALAQALWCKKKPSYEQFLATIRKHQEYFLSLNKINYAKSIHYPSMNISRFPEGIELNFTTSDPEETFYVQVVSDTANIRTLTEMYMGKDSYCKIFRDEMPNGTEHKITLSEGSAGGEFVYVLHQSQDLGRLISMNPAPHPKYNHNGSLNLVDGIRGTLPWKGSEWLGFNEANIELMMDLDEVQKLEGMKIGLLDSPGSWIYLPDRITVYISVDGINWEETASAPVAPKEQKNARHQMDFKAETRYIKLRIQAMDEIPAGMDGAGSVPWTFIDEIELIYAEP